MVAGCALLLALALAPQSPDGPGASASTWSLNSFDALLWNGSPYLPVGARIDGDPETIRKVVAAGVRDLIVELPADGAGWDQAAEALEETGARYVVAIKSLAPSAVGIAVEPDAYRVAPIAGPRTISVTVPGGTDALVLLAALRDGDVNWQKRMPLVDGKATLEVDPKTDSPHVLLLYPQVHDLRTIDFWEGFDLQRDRLLRAFRQTKLGPGFRGLLDPLGVVKQFPSPDHTFVPFSRLFQLELSAYLERRYGKPDLVARAWALGSNDLARFEEYARLVPLFAASRGVQNVWDPQTDRLYSCESGKSNIWQDIQSVVKGAASRRYARFVNALSKTLKVPIYQTWAGWSGPYEENVVLDGVAFGSADAAPSAVAEAGSRAASTVLRRTKPGLLLAADLAAPAPDAEANDLASRTAEAESLGARAVYFRTTDTAQLQEIARLAAERAADPASAQWKPSALYFPEAAWNPAYSMRLVGGLWWLPGPGSGGALDFGPEFSAYQYTEQGKHFLAIWRPVGQADEVSFKAVDPKAYTFRSIDGEEVRPRIARDGFRVRVGSLPLIIEGPANFPVPDASLARVISQIKGVILGPGSNPANDGKQRLASLTAAVDADPGGSYLALQMQIRDYARRQAPYIWLEGEVPTETNFSAPRAYLGASENVALQLDQRLSVQGEVSYADYVFRTRSPGPHEVWLAARLPQGFHQGMLVRFGTTLLATREPPTSRYADGFAWYKLGMIDLPAGAQKLTIELPTGTDASLAIDAIMLSPFPFRPDAARMPMEWIFPAPEGKDKPDPFKKPDSIGTGSAVP